MALPDHTFELDQIYVLIETGYTCTPSFAKVVGFTKSGNPRLELLPRATTIMENVISHATYRVVPLPSTGDGEIKAARLCNSGDNKLWYVKFRTRRSYVKEIYDPSKKFEYTTYH